MKILPFPLPFPRRFTPRPFEVIRKRGATRGPEMVPPLTDASWTTTGTTPPTISGGVIHFVAASNIASAFNDSVPLEDNVTYEVIFTLTNYVNGGCRINLAGATTAHGSTGTTRSANGTYSELATTNGASTSSTAVRVQCTGTTGNNNFDVTVVSVKKVL